MSRYPGKYERALNDEFDYSRKLREKIKELEAQVAELERDLYQAKAEWTEERKKQADLRAQVAQLEHDKKNNYEAGVQLSKQIDTERATIAELEAQVAELRKIVGDTARIHLDNGMFGCSCPCCNEVERTYQEAKAKGTDSNE